MSEQLSPPLEDAPSEEVSADPVLTISSADKLKFLNEIKSKEAELTSVSLDLDSFGPWSNSKYKSLKKCPFQFYLKYVLKFKVPEIYQTQSDPTSANVGKAAHEILEKVLLGSTVDKAYAAVKKNYVGKKTLTPEVWTEKVEALHFNISKFKEKIEGFALRNPVKRVFTELRMGVTRDFQPTGFFSDDVWLRGVIDLILVLDCMDAVIFDHKTGGGLGGVRGFEEQLDWYKVLYHFGIQKTRGVQTGIHFIGEGEVKMANYSAAADIESNLRNSLEMSLEGAIDLLKEKGYFKHVRGNYCKWCEYDNIGCKSGELKPLELSTKRWIEIKKA